MKQLNIKYLSGRRKQAGATLLVIIIAMIVVAVIGTALYTLTSTALLNQVVAQRAARAYYLAESGIRITAGEYKKYISDSDYYTKLCALHNKTLTLPDNVSSVQVGLYPLWLYAHDAIAAKEPSIKLYLPGGAPEDDAGTIVIPTKGLLKVNDQDRDPVWNGDVYTSYTGIAVDQFNSTYGTPVTFNLYKAFDADIKIGDEFYIGSADYTTATAVSAAGGDLTLNVPDINMAKIFPSQNGSFLVVFVGDPIHYYYKYDYRIINSTANTVKLTNIQKVDTQPALFPLNINSSGGDQVYMCRTIGFSADSQYGD